MTDKLKIDKADDHDVRTRNPDGSVIVPQKHSYDIRCAHLDRNRPPMDEDQGQEYHGRCPMRFPFEPYAEHDWQRIYCPVHRNLYRPGRSATVLEVQTSIAAIESFKAGAKMPSAAEDLEEKLLTDADYQCWLAKKEAQLNAAREKGVL